MNIIIKNLDEKAPLYHRYQNQTNPQPAYIELDCRAEGELMADYSGEIGNAVPAYVWHGRAVRWQVPAEASGDSLRELFADQEFLAVCERIHAGYDDRWDGSNHVGDYSDDATAAIKEAARLIERAVECVEVWDVADWLFTECRLADHWSNCPLSEAVANLEAAPAGNEVINGDLADALVEKAQELFDYNPEKLQLVHVEELHRREQITAAELADWVVEYGEK